MKQDVTATVRCFCAEIGSELIAGAFVYGSVATGADTPQSDIDLFVLTRREVSASERSRLGAEFTRVQRHLGYTPDLTYPIELFTAGQCRVALAGRMMTDAIRMARGGVSLDARLRESDELEIFRALVGIRLPVVSGDELDVLTGHARRLVIDLPPPTRHQVLALLGVKRLASAPGGD